MIRPSLEEALRRFANDVIKQDRAVGWTSYNITNIRSDVDLIEKKGIRAMSVEEQTKKGALLDQEPLPEIKASASFAPQLDALAEEATPLLTQRIEPTKPLEDLLSDSALQAWVKEGVELHKGKKADCAFCRQKLPHDLWGTLSEHFNQASETLATAIDVCMAKVRAAIEETDVIPTIESSALYATERDAFVKARIALADILAAYKADLGKLSQALTNRRSSLFRVARVPLFDFDEKAAHAAVEAFNEAIAASDRRSASLAADKADAKQALRLDKVAAFLNGLDMPAKQEEIKKLSDKDAEAGVALVSCRDAERALEREIKQLEAQQKDERKGAERVNALLSHYFGHGGMQLEAVDDGAAPAVKFQVMRGGATAYNLSEGECSLLAFCYFMAKLDALGSSGKDLTIYIDDPISSLDSNHVFFAYALIDSLLETPVRKPDGTESPKYKQLFISTHNLEFLKYLKRLSAPNKQVQHFLVERHGDAASRLSLMPQYLKSYVTEFNYLFHQIHKCSLDVPAGAAHDHFFSFGNNLRKFLEAYLYFKFPHGGGDKPADARMAKFFGEDEMAKKVAGRIGHELSHLEESFDRSMKPIDIPEIQKIAAYVLAKVKGADDAQYESLLASIGAGPAPA